MSADLGDYWKQVARARGFRLSVIAPGQRNEVIERCKQEVMAHGGDILDFKQFSNLSLNLIVEVSGKGALAIVDGLAGLGWQVKADPAREALDTSEVLEGTLEITFPGGDGSLKDVVPKVPG